MATYAYPITIKPTPQRLVYTKQVDLPNDGVLTLAILRTLVKEDEKFSISEKEDSRFCISQVLHISGERLENATEVKMRVQREEEYMNEYNKRHNKG